jgi:hypothetical protein
MSPHMLVYLLTVELSFYPKGSCSIGLHARHGCNTAWRHRAFVRLSGRDAARVENYTERGDVVLDGDDRVASVRVFVVPGRLRVG